VVDDDKNIIGKIGQYDVIAALEPKYKEMGEIRNISRAGFNLDFIKSLLDKYALCERPFPESCRNAGELKVKEVMHTLTEGEYVKSEESLCDAIHQLVLGNHQSLLVVEGEKIVGILRLTDVFHYVFQTMEQACKKD
jgi:CBS-domain-containing membrane protein